MESVDSKKKDVKERLKSDFNRVAESERNLVIISAVTIVVTAIVGVLVVAVLTVLNEANQLGGYLNSIPRIMERRDAYLASTDAFYSHDFTVRGEIAAMIYDNVVATDPTERVSIAKEAVNAAGIALVDENGDVIADTEAPVSNGQDGDVTLPVVAPMEMGTTSPDGTEPPEGEPSAAIDVGEIEQVISAEENLIIINDDETTGEGVVTISTPSASEDPEESAEDGEGSEDAEPKSADADGAENGEADGETSTDAEEGEVEPPTYEWNAVDEGDEVADAEAVGEDTSTYVYYRAKVEDGSTLIVKFDPTASLSVNQEEGQWEKLLNRLVAGIDAYAFVREDETGTWTGYPLTSVTQDEIKVLEQGLTNIDDRITFPVPFADEKGFDDVRFGVTWLFGKLFLVELRSLPEKGLTFVMARPFSRFFPGPLRSSLVIILFFILSNFLLVHFIRANLAGISDEEDDEESLMERMFVRCHGGLIIVIVVLAIFSLMMIMLGKSAMTSTTARNQRESLSYELEHQERIVGDVLEEYGDASVTQTKALARLLSDQPQLRTRSDLKRLADIVGARYLMLFDKAGSELFSSNSYVGFQIGRDEELSVETIVDAPGLQAVLLGESCVVSGPVEDSQGNTYRIIAALVTDADDLPDGFLVMAADDPKVDKTYEDDLSPLMNRAGQVALVVDDETGVILKHSDVTKVGDPVSAYLSDEVLGHSYEGYTWYESRYVYMSSDSQEGTSTIVLSMNTMGIEDIIGLAALVALTSMFICLYYYPLAVKYCCISRKKVEMYYFGNPVTIFLYGYNIFFCILSIFAYISSLRGQWPEFSAVFEGAWSKGINQFAMWSALFFTAQATSIVYVVKRFLKRMAENSDLSARTILRLMDSLITYVSAITVALVDLTWFGVDTSALIASAGIVSIAVGMGAKDLISDILAGMFIIFESSVHVGDIVEIGTWRGTITDMGIRTCEITDRNNNVKVVNNSHISELVNFSRKSTSCTMEFEMIRDIPVRDVPAIVDEFIESLTREVPEVANSLHFVGITDITDDHYKITLGWMCDESQREALTFRLNTEMRLILERARRRKAAGDSTDHKEQKADQE